MNDYLVTCEDCKKEFQIHKIAAIVPRNPKDKSCNPFTDLVKYCRECWPKHEAQYSR